METLIKTKVCNYSRSAQDNGDSRRIILHTDAEAWSDQLHLNALLCIKVLQLHVCPVYLWIIDRCLEELLRQINFDVF